MMNMRMSVIAIAAAAFLASCGSAGRSQVAGKVWRLSFVHGGLGRECLVYAPPRPGEGPRPLLLAIHGGGGTARGMMSLTRRRFNELADRDGFYVAYPSGIEKHWNDMRRDPIDRAHRENIDDIGFIRNLVGRIAARYPVDRNRVFAAGISNGGFMSLRLACEASDLVRGAAAVSAQNPAGAAARCRPARQVSVLIINGTGDPIVPYNGGEVELFGRKRGRVDSTDDTVRFWSDTLKCGPAAESALPDTDPADGTKVTVVRRSCAGGAALALYRVEGGGHAWPGGVHYFFESTIGRTSRDFNACDEIWEFFRAIQ